MPRQQTQLDKIKTDLLNGRAIDSVYAFERHHITRISALVHRLRGLGWPIASTRKQGGKLAIYRLPEGWRPNA